LQNQVGKLAMSLPTVGSVCPSKSKRPSSESACRSRVAQATGAFVLNNSKGQCRFDKLWRTVCVPQLVGNEQPDLAKLQLYFKGLNVKPEQINMKNPETKWTFLHHFAYQGNADLIVWALQAGADPNAANAMGKTPLHLAVEANKPAAVKTLLKGGANVSAKTLAGFTMLHLAVLGRHKNIVRILLENFFASVDVHSDSVHGTPLEMAKDPEIREMLLEYTSMSVLESPSAMPTPKSKRMLRLSACSSQQFSESGSAVPTPKSTRILLQPLLTRDFSGQSVNLSMDMSHADRHQLQAIARQQLNLQ